MKIKIENIKIKRIYCVKMIQSSWAYILFKSFMHSNVYINKCTSCIFPETYLALSGNKQTVTKTLHIRLSIFKFRLDVSKYLSVKR